MKDCCKTGSETKQKRSGFKKWFNYTIIVIGVLILQLTGD